MYLLVFVVYPAPIVKSGHRVNVLRGKDVGDRFSLVGQYKSYIKAVVGSRVKCGISIAIVRLTAKVVAAEELRLLDLAVSAHKVVVSVGHRQIVPVIVPHLLKVEGVDKRYDGLGIKVHVALAQPVRFILDIGAYRAASLAICKVNFEKIAIIAVGKLFNARFIKRNSVIRPEGV